MYGLGLAGEEDAFATREAGAVATGMTAVAPGLATARGIGPERARWLTCTRHIVELAGRCAPDTETARAVVAAVNIDRKGTVAVHARDVRGLTDISTTDAECELGSALVDRSFGVDLDDPGHELRACFSEDACPVGWTAAEAIRDFTDWRPTGRPFFQPSSMAPVNARAFVNVTGTKPGVRILDPMCGTGGVLLEAGLTDADIADADVQAKMVGGAREGLRHYIDSGDAVRGDVATPPLCDGSMDGAVFDAPYGRRSKIARHSPVDLVGDALVEVCRVTPECVVITDRSWAEAVEDTGWGVERVLGRRVHRSLMRYVHLLYW